MQEYNINQIVVIILGIITSTLTIIGLVIKAFLSAHKTSLDYFMKSLDKKDELINLQHEELKDIIERGHQINEQNNTVLEKFTSSIDQNSEIERQNSERFTSLLVNTIQSNNAKHEQ